jgi:hypothetical protein
MPASKTLKQVIDNIKSVVKAITPTKDIGVKFNLVDDDAAALGDQPITSGIDRVFEVNLRSKTWPEVGYWAPAERETHVLLDLFVGYQKTGNRIADQEWHWSDLHDLQLALDNQTNWGSVAIFQQTGPEVPQTIESDPPHSLWVLRIPITVHFLEVVS